MRQLRFHHGSETAIATCVTIVGTAWAARNGAWDGFHLQPYFQWAGIISDGARLFDAEDEPLEIGC